MPPRFVELSQFAHDERKLNQAGGHIGAVVAFMRACQRVPIESGSLFVVLASSLQIAQRQKIDGHAARIADGSRQLEGASELLFSSAQISQQSVKVSQVVQSFDEFAFQAHLLVNAHRRTKLLERQLVLPQAQQRLAFALVPIRILLFEAGLARQQQGAVEGAEGVLDLSRTHVAEGEIPEVLAR